MGWRDCRRLHADKGLAPARARVKAAGERFTGIPKRLRWRRDAAGTVKDIEHVLAWQHTLIDEFEPAGDDHGGATEPRSQDSTAAPATTGRIGHLIGE